MSLSSDIGVLSLALNLRDVIFSVDIPLASTHHIRIGIRSCPSTWLHSSIISSLAILHPPYTISICRCQHVAPVDPHHSHIVCTTCRCATGTRGGGGGGGRGRRSGGEATHIRSNGNSGGIGVQSRVSSRCHTGQRHAGEEEEASSMQSRMSRMGLHGIMMPLYPTHVVTLMYVSCRASTLLMLMPPMSVPMHVSVPLLFSSLPFSPLLLSCLVLSCLVLSCVVLFSVVL